MSRSDPRKLKDDAADYVSRGKWKRALECYEALERLEPKDGTWPQRAGEMHRRLLERAHAVAALTRAADVYSEQGFLLKAVAVCKLMLEIDPTRREVEARLARLHAARGFKPAGPRRAAVIAAVPEPEPEAPAPPLVEVALQKVVPGARRSEEIAARGPSAVFEIPLEPEIEIVDEPLSASQTARALLPRTPLFSSLDEPHLRAVLAQVGLRQLEAGEVLFRRGDPADALYVIAAGEVRVLAGPEEQEIARLAEGAFFGEIALLSGHPRTATIQATFAADLLVIDRSVVASLIAGSPEMLKVLLRFMRDRLLDTLVATNPLFTPFAHDERRALAARFKFLDVQPGAILVERGGRSPGLFIVLAGDVGADGPPLGYGSLFGESSLLARAVEPVEIRARSKALCLILPRPDFQEIIMTHPQVLEHLTNVGSA